MNIKLNNLAMANFKGLREFSADFSGENAVIAGANGTGKTTTYDGFLWLLFGKDSTGRKSFEVRPLDSENQPIKGLVVAVIAEISFDGVSHVFRKEEHEKIVKGQLRGYETLCYIDEVPKKISEYADYIAELIPEDTFKLLTDIHFFNEKIHWTDRRTTLLDIAGTIGTPKGFEELLAKLNGRSIEEYKKVLFEQKKRITKDLEEINPRIDELNRNLAEAGSDVSKLTIVRQAMQEAIAVLDAKRKQLFEQEKTRQASIDTLNKLKSEKVAREGQLARDTSSIDKYIHEKRDIAQQVEKVRESLLTARRNIGERESEIRLAERELQNLTLSLNDIRVKRQEADADTPSGICSACGQSLPADKIKDHQERKALRIAEICKKGNTIKAEVDAKKQIIAQLNEKLTIAKTVVEKTQITVSEAEQNAIEQFKKLDALIANRATTPPEKDPVWNIICENIKKAETEVGPSAADQLDEIEEERTGKASELAEINTALAQADRAEKDKVRIAELEAKEKELAQSIADIDKLLADIDSYKATESKLIETAVNKKFKHVEFKLFKELLNGGLEDTCEAMLNGVPYSDMSCGQKIIVGIDIINVLSEHYELSVPLFVDNAESLTLPNESISQTIELFAKKNVKKIIISVNKTEKAVA